MKNIFLLDNNIIYLSSLEAQLRAQKSNVLARHGEHGEIHTFKEILLSQPEIIIMDIIFPSFEGLSLMHRIRGDHDTNHIPIAVYTSIGNKCLKETSRMKGAEHFFIKEEFEPENLIKRLFKIYKLR